MAMEITGILSGLKGYDRVEKTEPASRREKGTKSSATARGDSVHLSSEAKLFSSGVSAAQSAPDVRQARVDELRALVESGDYKPDLQKTAAKLVEEDLELLL